jgi:hypothetical protein
MADSLVVNLMRDFKAALLLREQQQQWEMAARWLQIEHALEAQVAALVQQVYAERAAGREVSQARLFRLERYQSLLAQARQQIGEYNGYAADLITRQQDAWGQLGLAQAAAAIQASYQGAGRGIGVYFDRLPVEAIRNMVGLVGDGTPLRDWLDVVFPTAADAMTRELVVGTARGRNPNVTARAMFKGLSEGFNRVLNCARTEQIRVYREASRSQYEASGVVEGFYRLAAHDTRTCAACLMAEGELYTVRESLRDHNQGRCTAVPKVEGLPAPAWQKGPDWFRAQGPEMQAAILGKGKYAAWKAGKFDLDQLVTVRRDATWGDSVTPTPLRELVSA